MYSIRQGTANSAKELYRDTVEVVEATLTLGEYMYRSLWLLYKYDRLPKKERALCDQDKLFTAIDHLNTLVGYGKYMDTLRQLRVPRSLILNYLASRKHLFLSKVYANNTRINLSESEIYMIVLAGIIEKDQVKPNIGLRRRSSIIASSPIKNNCLEDIVKCEERQVPLCINPHEFQGWTQGKVITQLTVFGVYSRKWDEFMIACEKLKDNHLNNFVASNLRIDLRNWRHHLIGRDSLGDDGQLLEANASYGTEYENIQINSLKGVSPVRCSAQTESLLVVYSHSKGILIKMDHKSVSLLYHGYMLTKNQLYDLNISTGSIVNATAIFNWLSVSKVTQVYALARTDVIILKVDLLLLNKICYANGEHIKSLIERVTIVENSRREKFNLAPNYEHYLSDVDIIEGSRVLLKQINEPLQPEYRDSSHKKHNNGAIARLNSLCKKMHGTLYIEYRVGRDYNLSKSLDRYGNSVSPRYLGSHMKDIFHNRKLYLIGKTFQISHRKRNKEGQTCRQDTIKHCPYGDVESQTDRVNQRNSTRTNKRNTHGYWQAHKPDQESKAYKTEGYKSHRENCGIIKLKKNLQKLVIKHTALYRYNVRFVTYPSFINESFLAHKDSLSPYNRASDIYDSSLPFCTTHCNFKPSQPLKRMSHRNRKLPR